MRMAISLLTVFLIACGQGSQTLETAQKTQSSAAPRQPPAMIPGALPLPEVTVDMSSPDRALTSFFAFQDRNLVARFNQALQEVADPKQQAHLNSATILFDGPAKRYIDRILKTDTPILERYERDISKVETESETRAIVFVNIKNVTPLLPGAVLDKYDTKWRSEGFNFRYVMTKTAEGWKIGDVQEWSLNVATMKDAWQRSARIPSAEGKPWVPGMVSPLF